MSQNTFAQAAGPSQPQQPPTNSFQQQPAPSADRRQSILSSGTTQAPPRPNYIEDYDFYSKRILENVDVVMRRFGHPHQEYQIVTKLGKTVTQGQEQSHWKSYVLNAANGAPGVQGKSFANHSGTLGALMELYLETCKKLDELLDDKTRGQFGNVGYFK